MKINWGLFLIVFLLVYTAVNYFTPYDTTDDAVNGERSGMGLYQDNLTGCHYLSAGYFGGLSPRLDSNGNHICS